MATLPGRPDRRRWRLQLLAASAAASAAAASSRLPAGVTLCDGSAPVGEVAAHLLAAPLPYCMNHGACREDYAARPDAPCACPAGFAGPHCEFRADDAGAVPDCTLRCFGGGICQAGAKSFELLDSPWLAPEDLQYCLCAVGFEGDQCEREAAPYGADGEPCRHGGTCATGTGLDGAAVAYCDCTTADGAFAGRYCEAEATALCAEDGDAAGGGRAFCTNGGTCAGGTALGCDCPDGYTGPVCEFEGATGTAAAAADAAAPECTLQCFNGGLCRRGAADTSYLARFGLHRDLTYERRDGDGDGEQHCACPSGFAGRQCEFQMEVCPGGDAVCLHGGTCALRTDAADGGGGGGGMGCDCATAETALARFAGEACEVRSTEFCTLGGQKTVVGPHYDAFCTQSGRCRAVVADGQRHPGCDCPAGTSGPHCEFGTPAVPVEPRDGRRALGLALGVLLAALLVGAGWVAYRRRRRRRRSGAWYRRNHLARLGAPSFQDCPPPPTMAHIMDLHGRRDRRRDEEGRFVNDLASVSSLGLSESSSVVGFDDDGYYVPPLAAAWDDVTFEESLPDGKAILMKPPAGAAAATPAHSDPTDLIL